MLIWFVIEIVCILSLTFQALYLAGQLKKKKKEIKEKDKKLADWKKHCANLEIMQEYFMNHIDSLNSEIKQFKEMDLKYK